MQMMIRDLMQQTGVNFGTSGARGLALKMTDCVCYAYTLGFLQYLESIGELKKNGETVAVAGDLRPSTGRIMAAVARAAESMGHSPMNCGRIPSPAVALYGFENAVPAVMVTGSHIPADRNGIKFNKASGEILKPDEAGIMSQLVDIPDALFNEDGSFIQAANLPAEDPRAGQAYVRRYLDAFPSDCLAGKKIGIYQHSAVGREQLVEIFQGLGADVTPLGLSDTFVPVDTEAIRDEDVGVAKIWSAECSFDSIISTDGDSDRPLISDEYGRWLRGDIVGILAATYLGADSISTPVSCNTALEKCGWFAETRRTKIGSPYVIDSMIQATASGKKSVMGYEANGGFLLNSDVEVGENTLSALPTRDAVLPVLVILLLSMKSDRSIAELVKRLPNRITLSGRIQDYPVTASRAVMKNLEDPAFINASFESSLGMPRDINTVDGFRMTFSSSDILHFRPSGNAPEFRCYAEADTYQRASEIIEVGVEFLKSVKGEHHVASLSA